MITTNTNRLKPNQRENIQEISSFNVVPNQPKTDHVKSSHASQRQFIEKKSKIYSTYISSYFLFISIHAECVRSNMYRFLRDNHRRVPRKNTSFTTNATIDTNSGTRHCLQFGLNHNAFFTVAIYQYRNRSLNLKINVRMLLITLTDKPSFAQSDYFLSTGKQIEWRICSIFRS